MAFKASCLKSFDFKQPELWPSWRQRYERFSVATALNEKSFQVQLCTLILAMGTEAEQIYKTFAYNEAAEDANIQDVLAKFDTHFNPQRNIIHLQCVFNQRNQAQGESIEEFIRALYELSEHAQFADRNEAIRNRLVLGVLDRELSKKLQLEKDLTLALAIQLSRQHELVTAQLSEQRTSLDSVKRGHGRGQYRGTQRWGSRGRGRGKQGHTQSHSKSQEGKCGRCGHEKHSRDACPAMGKQCNTCRKYNHFSACCRSTSTKKAETVDARYQDDTSSEAEADPYFLGSVNSKGSAWYTEICVLANQ